MVRGTSVSAACSVLIPGGLLQGAGLRASEGDMGHWCSYFGDGDGGHSCRDCLGSIV